MPTKYCTIHLQQDTQAIRLQEFDGREHIVIPAIGLVEGVLRGANSPQPELALAEEFGRFPEAWNGRPVTFGHPERDNNFVSAASSPEVFEEEAVGIIFNTEIDGTKLKMDFFLDPDKAPPSEIERLKAGPTVEVSTGFFADVLQVSGNFEGEEFGGIFTNITPDHVAILAEDEIGACSVEDGCGAPRLNSLKVNAQGEVTISHEGCEKCQKDKSGDKAMKDNASKFFFDSLVQFSDEGETLSLGEDVAVENLGETPLVFVLVDFRKDVRIEESFDEKMKAFDRAGELADRVGGHIGVAESVGVRTNKAVVYRLIAAFVGESRMNGKKKVDFSNNVAENDHEITESDNFLSSLVKKVKRLLQTEEIRMDKAGLIAKVVANDATPFVEGDIEALEGFSEERLEALAKIEAVEKETSEGKDESKDSDGGDVETFTSSDVFETLPTEVKGMLKRGLEAEKAKRTSLTAQIKDRKDCPYTSKQLEAFDLDELATLAKWTSKLSGEVEDFSGQGAPNVNSGDEKQYVAPRIGRIFDIKQAAA